MGGALAPSSAAGGSSDELGRSATKPGFPPALAVAIAVVSVSFAAPLFRLADAPAVTASFWRLAFAVLLLLPFSYPAVAAWRGYSAREWLITALCGAALAFHFALWVTSLERTSVAAATALVTLQAVFVAIGGHFLGDRLTRRAAVGIAAAVAGGAIIAFGDSATGGAHALSGDALALLAGLGSAAYMLIGRRLRNPGPGRQERGLIEYVVPVYAFAALGLAVAAPLVGHPLLGFGSGAGPTVAFVVFVLLAAVPMLGGHTMSNWALRHLPAHTIASWILLEPVGAALLAWPLLGEVAGALTVVGGIIVLAGASLTIPRTSGRRAVADEVAG